ncbi:MAG: methionyl-tRNA formyltransferase [Chloroflexi bacterium]|nr:methionyl-tRNA formyltransferase [Chloroflexota bacterium]
MTPPLGARPGRAVRVVFFGSGAFAVPALETLIRRDDVELVGVVTPPDRSAGRSGALIAVPVAAAARTAGLPLLQVDRVRSSEAVDVIRRLAPDLGVLADFGQLIPQAILDLPRFGILNVHPSLLPRHRGASPIPATILAADALAGVSIMQMDAGLDTGPILAAVDWPLNGTEDTPELESRAAHEAADLLDHVVTSVLAGHGSGTPQAPLGITMTRTLNREAGRLDPRLPAAELERRVRAFRPWPGTFVEIPQLRLGIREAAVGQAQPGDVPGVVVADGAGIALSTVDGRLSLTVVQPAGRWPMSGAAFRRGHPAVVGAAVVPVVVSVDGAE